MNVAPIHRRDVFYIAGPIILSNISTPLLGLVDTAVIGNLGDPALIGAIAVGGLIFSFLYWGFGFLRMGTTGLVAQARGAQATDEIKAWLYRALLLGIGLGLALVMLQQPLARVALTLLEGSSEVESAALTYFQIRIWRHLLPGLPGSARLPAGAATTGAMLGMQIPAERDKYRAGYCVCRRL